jgi:hypothetical protein
MRSKEECRRGWEQDWVQDREGFGQGNGQPGLVLVSSSVGNRALDCRTENRAAQGSSVIGPGGKNWACVL